MTAQSRPLVSIGITTYNRADAYLGEALQSAVAQGYPNLEIIVSDNCSQDHTEELVRSFEDPRIRYFKQEQNLGANGNFNFCLEQARGAYFLLLHDDDLIDPDFVELCMDAADDATHFGVLRTGARVIDGEGRVISEKRNPAAGLSTAGFILAWFAHETPSYLCNTLYHTQRLKEIGGFRSKANVYDDVAPLIQLAARHGRVDVADVKASFRRHESNSAAANAPSVVERWCEDSLHILEIMCEEVPEAADVLRKEGLVYFTRRNYRHAEGIGSRAVRAKMYWSIYKRFDYSYSPFRFLYRRMVRRPVRRLKRHVRSRLRPTS
jgi:glycosyltransferase involved in cell wall biosynthesis